MPDDTPSVRFPFKRQIPALRIFEVAGLTLSPASILIASIASVLLSLSGPIVDFVFPVTHAEPTVSSIALQPIAFEAFLQMENISNQSLTRPWSSVIQPVVSILGDSAGGSSILNNAFRFAIAIGLWSLVGVILCRRSAAIFIGNDESTIHSAIIYSLKRWHSTIGAPLIPLATMFIIGLIVAASGLPGGLPYLGNVWILVISPAILIMGFLMAFLLLATALGWPLMVAAVSTDDCDSFGGLSRAYSGLMGRPWHVIGFSCLVAIVGMMLISVVYAAAETTIWCAMSGVAFGSGNERARESLLVPLSKLVHTIVSGIGISFFWSAATVIYLLIRQEVDGVPLDQIAADDDSRPVRDPFPVVGIPATDSKTDSNGKFSSG